MAAEDGRLAGDSALLIPIPIVATIDTSGCFTERRTNVTQTLAAVGMNWCHTQCPADCSVDDLMTACLAPGFMDAAGSSC